MKSLASLVAVAALQVPLAPPPGTPSGSSEEASYDTVVRAAIGDLPGVRVAVPAALPADTVVEITALDTGRTIVALTGGSAPAPALSPAAASALGVADGAAIRIRRTVASPAEFAALQAGGAASARADAPPALLTGLRRLAPAAGAPPRRPVRVAVPIRRRQSTTDVPPAPLPTPEPTPIAETVPRATPSPRPARAVRPKPAPRPTPVAAAPRSRAAEPIGVAPRYYVQVISLSDASRAQMIAYTLGGRVEGRGPYRVQMGPYVTREAAESGRAVAVRRGHGGARIYNLR